MDNSYILHETPLAVVIASGFKRPSANSGTGALIQVWILRKDLHPVEAVKSGAASAVCFDCPLSGNGCYVNLLRGPAPVWNKYRRGEYKLLRLQDYKRAFGGKLVRFGAYGEPVLIPPTMVSAIADLAAGWTGYTHQWRNPALQHYRRWFMASTDKTDYLEAQAMGWRTYTVSREQIAGQMICPKSHEFEAARGYRLTCADCKLCCGNARKARSIQIAPHGAQAKKVA